MNNIPSEILQKIFLLLHQHDKVVCMTVCRAWNYIIESSILFDTVCLYNKQQFNHFISKNRREPNQCEKIRRLIIEMKHIEAIEMDILPLVILNLRELYFYESFEKYNLRFTTLLSPHSWSNTIEKINEKSSNILTTHILKGGVCPNLTEISVHGGRSKLGKALIGLLVNAPALKSLSFKSYNVSLEDIESLHKATPLLSSFELSYGAVECATLPTGIQPMFYIKKLTLEYITVATSPAYIVLQRYLTAKYPMVSELVHRISIDSRGDVNYNFTIGFDLQIKQIRTHLTSLKMSNNNCFEDIIPILDKNDCRIKTMGMNSSTEASEVSRLARSAQAGYIQSLSLYSISTESFINFIGTLPMLTRLELYCTPHSVQEGKTVIGIHRLLEQVGNTLNTLRLCQAHIEFDLLTAHQYPSLRHLELQKNIIPKHFDHFISQSFPKLQNLILDDIFWTEPSFYLGDLNLAYLELRKKVPFTNPCVLIVTTSNNKKRCYTARSVPKHRRSIIADPTTFPAINSLPVDSSNGLPCITFVCNSVCEFFLVNLTGSQSIK